MKTCIVIGLIITVDFVSKGYPIYDKDIRLSLYITRKFHTNSINFFLVCLFESHGNKVNPAVSFAEKMDTCTDKTP